MPIPFLLGAAAVLAGVAGIVKGGEAMMNNDEAKELIADARSLYNTAKDKLEKQRDVTTKDLESLGKLKLDVWSKEVGTFVSLFNHYKKMQVPSDINVDEKLRAQINNPNNLKNMEVAAMKASEVVKVGVYALGSGALAGIASYGGAMMFASASTGTAIASLTGAAATNATLAWFGGGSLAAGGLGMAGGTAMLGGIVAGPVLAVAGFIMAAKSEENLAKAKEAYSEAKLAAEQMKTMTAFMNKVSSISNNYSSFINEFSKRYRTILNQMSIMYKKQLEQKEALFLNKVKKAIGMDIKIDFRHLTNEEQRLLQLAWLMTQIYYAVLSAPILTQDGNIAPKAQETLNSAKQSTQKLIGVNS